MSVVIFDIETGPLPDDELRAMLPEFSVSSITGLTLGEFDPKSVKLGIMKDPVKIEAKIAAVRKAHEKALAESVAKVEKARSEHWTKFVSKAALSALTGRVLAIGYFSLENRNPKIHGEDEEYSMLKIFWEQYVKIRTDNRTMAGWNIKGFDLPFLVRRSWKRSIDVPESVFHKRYWSLTFLDLMSKWQLGNRQEFLRLDLAAKYFGCNGKPDGITGGDFARLWAEDRPTAISYLSNDLEMTATVAERMGVV